MTTRARLCTLPAPPHRRHSPARSGRDLLPQAPGKLVHVGSQGIQHLSPKRIGADMPMSWLANKTIAKVCTIAARESWVPDET